MPERCPALRSVQRHTGLRSAWTADWPSTMFSRRREGLTLYRVTISVFRMAWIVLDGDAQEVTCTDAPLWRHAEEGRVSPIVVGEGIHSVPEALPIGAALVISPHLGLLGRTQPA